jgi:hypothetical protein
MLIPLRHENMQGRRWPVITIGLIALNAVIFLGTHWKMDEQAPELGEVRTHIILLAAMQSGNQHSWQSAGFSHHGSNEESCPVEAGSKSESRCA